MLAEWTRLVDAGIAMVVLEMVIVPLMIALGTLPIEFLYATRCHRPSRLSLLAGASLVGQECRWVGVLFASSTVVRHQRLQPQA